MIAIIYLYSIILFTKKKNPGFFFSFPQTKAFSLIFPAGKTKKQNRDYKIAINVKGKTRRGKGEAYIHRPHFIYKRI